MPINQIIHTPSTAPVKIWTHELEESAAKQLRNLATLPFIHKHIAVMPDVHMGIGSTVGSVIPTVKAVIPAAVGVDIGCGMMAVQLTLKASQLPDSLAEMRSRIEQYVPHGRTDNGGASDRGAWHNVPAYALASYATVHPALGRLLEKYPALDKSARRAPHHLGTLGTGNHFIEVCVDLEQNVWVMLHSGSRGIGNRIGQTFITLAKEEMERWHIKLADPDLAYLPEGTKLFDDYVEAVEWAQNYAQLNRNLMMGAVIKALVETIPTEFKQTHIAINCHHNYVARENHFGLNVFVTRKGAVRAREGDLGIIPGSMGTRSYIVRGKGNPESFNSCSHGAGRRMSRTEAKRRFTSHDLVQQTMGVECRKDADVVDEIPAAYKNIDQVMANQADLVEVVAELRQVLCVKG